MNPNKKELPFYNRRKCKKCIYSAGLSHYAESGNSYCNYMTKNPEGETCLYLDENHKVVDRRGYDKNDCKLFTPKGH